MLQLGYRLSFNTPFGGYKMSSIGTENGLESVREYTHKI